MIGNSHILALNRKIQNNKKTQDVCFRFDPEDGQLYAHKIFLSENSEVFERMFYGENWKENKDKEMAIVTITDIEKEIFQAFLDYCYTQEINRQLRERLIDLLYVADKYFIPHLKKDILSYFGDQFPFWYSASFENVFYIYEKSFHFNIDELHEKTFKHILNNPEQYFKYPEKFGSLNPSAKEAVLNLFKSTDLRAKEIDIVRCMIEYLKVLWNENNIEEHQFAEKRQIAAPFLQAINYNYLGKEGFLEIKNSNLVEFEELFMKSIERFGGKDILFDFAIDSLPELSRKGGEYLFDADQISSNISGFSFYSPSCCMTCSLSKGDEGKWIQFDTRNSFIHLKKVGLSSKGEYASSAVLFNIEYSDNGSLWTKLCTMNVSDGSTEFQLAHDGTHRYWRFTISAINGYDYININEIHWFT
jgi:hypothetical protein